MNIAILITPVVILLFKNKRCGSLTNQLYLVKSMVLMIMNYDIFWMYVVLAKEP